MAALCVRAEKTQLAVAEFEREENHNIKRRHSRCKKTPNSLCPFVFVPSPLAAALSEAEICAQGSATELLKEH